MVIGLEQVAPPGSVKFFGQSTLRSGAGIAGPCGTCHSGDGSGHACWCTGSKNQPNCPMKEGMEIEWTPGVETEPLPHLRAKSLLLGALVSFGLFCLLPLSEFVRPDEWVVRPVEVPTYSPPLHLRRKWRKKW